MSNGFPAAAASHFGNLIVNPSGTNPGEYETYLRCPGWWALDLSPLWGFPAYRGDNLVIPHHTGRRINPKRIDQGVYTLELAITGVVNATGGDNANAFVGLRTNLEWLWSNIGDPSTGDTRLAKLILPDASAITANCQFELALASLKGAEVRAMLDVIVPAGRF
jgi:hypothetical protein